MGDVIWADFKTKTFHRPATLEQQAQELAKEFNRMAEEGTEVVMMPLGEPFSSILFNNLPELYIRDAAPSEYVAPPEDCA